MFRNISNHFGGITDVRVATDPWGLDPPLEVEILRADHPDWVEWKKQNGFTGEEITQELLRAQVRRSLEPAAGKTGVRARARAMDSVVDDTVDRMAARIKASAEDGSKLEKLKEGLATVGIRRVVSGLSVADARCACGNTFTPEHGDDACTACGGHDWQFVDEKPVDDSVEARRKLLANVKDREGDPLWVPLTKKVQEADEDAAGELVEVDKPVPFGGQPVGDAIAAWLLSAMDEQEKFRKEFVERALGNSAPAPASSPVPGPA